MYNLERIRLDTENFCSELNREWYLNLAGLKDETNLSAVYEKYSHLFTKELILGVRDGRKKAKGEEETRLKYLQQLLTDQHLKMAVKELTDKAQTMGIKEKVKTNGEEIPFRLAVVKIINEPNRKKRGNLYDARNKVIDKINVILRERMRKLHEASRDLGYGNYMTLYKDIHGIDFRELQNKMQDFIKRTESIYVERMDKALQDKMGVKLEEAEKHDIAFFFRAKEYDRNFKKENVVGTLKRSLANMGIYLEKQKNIHLDTEERPKKSPRAYTVGIKVPDDIKLLLMPKGGHDDYASLLHEAGHCEHFGCVEPNLAFEYKWSGDNSVTESFAFLLEYLTMDKNWLRRYTNMSETREYLNFLYLYKLYFLRRYGAKLSYELKLHTSGLEGMDETYKETLEKALKFKHPKNHYLMDHDDGFYCAWYLRAWIFESQLKALLKEKYGEKWFNKAEAGEFLKKLWSNGQRYDVVELAQRLGYHGLNIEPLVKSIHKNLL